MEQIALLITDVQAVGQGTMVNTNVGGPNPAPKVRGITPTVIMEIRMSTTTIVWYPDRAN